MSHYSPTCTIQDEAPEDRKIPVSVKVESNELEYYDGRDEAKIYKRQELGTPNQVQRAKVFLAPFTCHDLSSNSPVLCELETTIGDPHLNSRYYDISVTATDEIGNVGMATCYVIVIPQDRPSTTSICAGGKSKSSNTHTSFHSDSTSSESPSGSSHSKSSKSKSSKDYCLEHDADDLRREFLLSTQRFDTTSLGLEWDTSLNTTRSQHVEPQPHTGKSGKSGSGSGKSGKSGNGKNQGKSNGDQMPEMMPFEEFSLSLPFEEFSLSSTEVDSEERDVFVPVRRVLVG